MQIFSLTFIFLAAVNSFDLLQDPVYEGGPIELHAFLYRSESLGMIASSDPGLKSCCKGAKNKIESQILLEIDPSHSHEFEAVYEGSVVLVAGELEKNFLDEWPKWRLKNARLKTNPGSEFEMVFLIAAAFIFIILFIFGWIWKKDLF